MVATSVACARSLPATVEDGLRDHGFSRGPNGSSLRCHEATNGSALCVTAVGTVRSRGRDRRADLGAGGGVVSVGTPSWLNRNDSADITCTSKPLLLLGPRFAHSRTLLKAFQRTPSAGARLKLWPSSGESWAVIKLPRQYGVGQGRECQGVANTSPLTLIGRRSRLRTGECPC